MHDDELWQVYNDNGMPIGGKGATRQEFEENPELIMGNAHVWFWKTDGTTTEIMLQKRSMNVKNRPGWYHISAGGHINVGETVVETAVREVEEEMGYVINPEKLHYVHSVRIIPRNPRDIVNVFLYRLHGNEEFTHTDGEAGTFEWIGLEDWRKITLNAEVYHLIPQGDLYFRTLTRALEELASKVPRL